MLRYMLCPVVGSGTIQDSYRAAVSDIAGVNTSARIPTHASGENIGQPIYDFALCQVAATSVGVISIVSNSLVFPDYPLDGRMDGMDANARSDFVQSIEAYNLDGNGFHLVADHDDADSWRDVINGIWQQVEPTFNVNQFSVGEVAS